jgi:hypothetical protein
VEFLEALTEHDLAYVQRKLKKTNVDGVYEWKRRTPEGGLRLIFSWGKGGLWCIGAFVKQNDAEGNRMLLRYRKLAESARKQQLPP